MVRYKLKELIGIIRNARSIAEFDMDLFLSLIEKMTVFEGEKIVTLLDGTEIECEIK